MLVLLEAGMSVLIMYCFYSLETSPITDSDTAKRTVFQRSYSVVASEYDKQHSSSPARVKAVPRRRVHSGDAGTPFTFCHMYSFAMHKISDWTLYIAVNITSYIFLF